LILAVSIKPRLYFISNTNHMEDEPKTPEGDADAGGEEATPEPAPTT